MDAAAPGGWEGKIMLDGALMGSNQPFVWRVCVLADFKGRKMGDNKVCADCVAEGLVAGAVHTKKHIQWRLSCVLQARGEEAPAGL